MPGPDELTDPGRLLAWYRQRRALSQRDLAERIGVHANHISGIERGETRMANVDELLDIAEVLHVTPLELEPRLARLPHNQQPQPEAEALATLIAEVPGFDSYLHLDTEQLPEVPPLHELRRQLDEMRQQLRTRSWARLIPQLVDLIPHVGVVQEGRASLDWAIVRTELLMLAAQTLAATNHPAPAWVAMDRALLLPTTPHQQTGYRQSVLLRLALLHATLGRPDWALRTARNVVTSTKRYVTLRPAAAGAKNADVPHLVVAGAAQLLTANWAAGAGSHTEAADALAAAHALADQLPPGEHTAYGFSLGPPTLRLGEITVAVTEGRHRDALHLAADLQPTVFATNAQRAVLAIQLSLAHLGMDQYRLALDQLSWADRMDPLEVTTNTDAQRAIAELLGARPKRGKLPGELVELVDRLR